MEAQIRSWAPEYDAYLRDESRTVGHAESISFPADEAELRAILSACAQRGMPVTVQGARTGLAAAAVPNGGHVLNLSRMQRILAMGECDGAFTITVQPGLPLSELRKAIAARRMDLSNFDEDSRRAYIAFCQAPEQFFPPDPTETSASIGGMVACNASGARSYRYGATRNHVVGFKLCLMDGQTLTLRRGMARAQGHALTLQTDQGHTICIPVPDYAVPATKNTSGYYAKPEMDAVDLFIGSDGTLGVFSELTLALSPLPQVIWGVTCLLPDEACAISLVQALRQQPLGIAALEYFDGHALDVLREQKRTHPGFAELPALAPEIGAALYVELHADDEQTAQRALLCVGEQLQRAGGNERDTWVARNQSELDKLLFFRHAVPESVNLLIDRRKQTHPGITKLGSDMAVCDADLPAIMDIYRTTAQELGLQTATWGHIGNNHVHVNVLPRDMDDYQKGKALFARWAQIITEMGGAVSAEHGVGKLKADYLAIMYDRNALNQMRAVKRALDPQYLLGVGTMFAKEEEA